MKIIIKYLSLLITLLFFFEACKSFDKNGDENFRQYRTQRIEQRDSLFIMYTVNAWSDTVFDIYRADTALFKTYPRTYFVASAFYSPDKKKMIVWIGNKFLNVIDTTYRKSSKKLDDYKLCYGGPDTVYNMSSLICYRPDTNSSWNVFPLDNERADCCGSEYVAISILDQYYFREMKNHQMWYIPQVGSQKGMRVGKEYGYNLQDIDFWDKCWLWERDTVGSDGLYPFEEDYNFYGKPCIKCAKRMETPHVVYPKEILDLYKK